MTEHSIAVEALVKEFVSEKASTGVRAVDDVSFTVAEGEFLCLLGPSGCGKTTTLRCIAGLERPDSGSIRLGEQTVYDADSGVYVPTEQRGLGMVFQSYAIWPHMRVFENVAYPLLRGAAKGRYSRDDVKRRVNEMLELVDCGPLGDRYPSELSGGQQQRVALARTLVYEPKVLLFDEPLSNLDAKLRERMRFELKAIQQRVGFTGIYVTHDQEEALMLADRIAVMANGKIRQIGPPEEIYERPVDGFVADFIGTANVLRVHELLEGNTIAVTDMGKLTLAAPADDQLGTDDLQVIFRPEQVTIVPAPEPGSTNVFQVTIAARGYVGSAHVYSVEESGRLRIVDHDRTRRLDVGDQVYAQVSQEYCRLVSSGGLAPLDDEEGDRDAASLIAEREQ